MLEELNALAGVDAPTLKDFWSWVEKTFAPHYRKEIEAYLADSVDHVDVENRIRTLQRRGLL
jgi:hypothetical protein